MTYYKKRFTISCLVTASVRMLSQMQLSTTPAPLFGDGGLLVCLPGGVVSLAHDNLPRYKAVEAGPLQR